MNYQYIYQQLIKSSKNKNRIKNDTDSYYEKHHIVPKCLGGNDDNDNLVLLTAREHFIAHKLLCEIYPDNDKLHYALWRMMNPQSKRHKRSYNISSYDYERRKKLQQEQVRKLGLSNKGRNISEEQKIKIREKRKLQIISEETKTKISNTLKNKPKNKITCPHCKKTGGEPQMKRFHFSNCKNMN
jgi:hypothetical protein